MQETRQPPAPFADPGGSDDQVLRSLAALQRQVDASQTRAKQAEKTTKLWRKSVRFPPTPAGAASSVTPARAAEAQPGSNTDKGVCRFHMRGSCKKGAACGYRHPASGHYPTSDEVCRDFNRGACTRPACKFQHSKQ
jgi:hypothetical protein